MNQDQLYYRIDLLDFREGGNALAALIQGFWRRTDLETLEEQEPVLHTGEGPLGFRSNLAIPSDQAQVLINELL